MTDKTDKPSAKTSHDALVEALESIKGLLEQGEEKLTIARESIKRANTSSQPMSALRKALQSTSDEEIVPVLDDIIDPDELDFEIPTLTTTATDINPGTEPDPQPPEPKQESAMKTTLDDNQIDTIQKNIEQIVRERLMKTMVKLENELKLEIKSQLDKLRNK